MSSFVDAFLKQTITSISTVSTNGYGETSFTSAYTTVKCRFQGITRQLVNAAGEQVLARVEIWLKTGYNLHAGDKIIYEGDSYYIINFSTKYDLFGQAEYIKCYLQ